MKNIVFYGHHKCGSRYVRHHVLRSIAQQTGYTQLEYKKSGKLVTFHELDELDLQLAPFASLNEPKTILSFINASARVVETVEAMKSAHLGIHVVRDPRQVLVSGYFHHLDGHPVRSDTWHWPRLEHDREVLRRLSLEDGLLYELDNISGSVLADQLGQWREADHVLEYRLEDLDGKLTELALKLGKALGLNEPLILAPSMDLRQQNVSSRDWSAVFTERVKQRFKERFNDLVIRWGYEVNSDW